MWQARLGISLGRRPFRRPAPLADSAQSWTKKAGAQAAPKGELIVFAGG